MRAFRAPINQRVNGKGGRWLRTTITIPPKIAKAHTIKKDDDYIILMMERDELNDVERIKDAIDHMLSFATMDDEVKKMKEDFLIGDFPNRTEFEPIMKSKQTNVEIGRPDVKH